MDTKAAGEKVDVMNAIVQGRFGSPTEVLTLQEVDRPAVKADEVLVRVRAASIHIGDVYMIEGLPNIMRPAFKRVRAASGVPGTDMAGTVEAVGENVTRFEPGDEVFGWCKGAFAEYVSTSEDALAMKPANITVDQAAAIGVSAMTALQALRDRGTVEPGQRVLIVGASGGVGTFAVQIAKSFGAEVTAVCSTRNLDMVRSIGADHVIDYTQQDFTQIDERYELILDNVGTHSLSRTRRALAPKGTLLANGTPISGWFGGLGHVIKAMTVSLFAKRQGRPFVSFPTAEDLAALRELAEAGKIVPVIDRTYPFEEAPEAIGYVGQGHAQGTTLIVVESE
jgi:NADPH:quinone reductase-like Zn-dependent oxidoreductase